MHQAHIIHFISLIMYELDIIIFPIFSGAGTGALKVQVTCSYLLKAKTNNPGKEKSHFILLVHRGSGHYFSHFLVKNRFENIQIFTCII